MAEAGLIFSDKDTASVWLFGDLTGESVGNKQAIIFMSFPLYLFYLKKNKTTRSLLISLIAPLRPTGYGIIYELLLGWGDRRVVS